MKYGIVVDSGCDLTGLWEETPKDIDFTRVPLSLDIGGKTFVDDFNLDIPAFMDEMYAYKGKTGSAAPSPDAYLSAFEKSENVFVVTITGTLSASFSSSKIAADIFKEKFPCRKIHNIDSKSTGPEISLLVKKLTELISRGLEFEEICDKIDEYHRGTHLLFVLESLSNLVKNGRVSKVAGAIAGALKIKALCVAGVGGTIDLIEKMRGKTKIYDQMMKEMLKMGYNGGRIIISHCFNPEIVEYMTKIIRSHFPKCHIEVMKTSGLCSYYSERGGLLIGFET